MANTTAPTITLKKGNLQIQVKNAAAILKRVNELKPEIPSNTHVVGEKEKYQMLNWKAAATDWFKNEFFGGTNDFEVCIEEGKPQEEPKFDVNTQRFSGLNPSMTKHAIESLCKDNPKHCVNESKDFDAEDLVKALVEDDKKEREVRTSNKNAYEIRSDVLDMALSWVKYKHDRMDADQPDDEDVLQTAIKFYKFVENKRW